MIYKLGAHLSIAGGYENPLHSIANIGGNCLQIFSTSPRGWSFAQPNKKQIDQFQKTRAQLQIDPVYFHATYLINLADNERIGQLSKQHLIHEMTIASQLGVKGSIVHLGSYKNDQLSIFNYQSNSKYKTLIQNIKEILDRTPKDTVFIIENAGNRKIGQQMDEIQMIMHDVSDNQSRLRVCLDTCHLFSAGYDLRTEQQLDYFLEEFDTKIGLEKLELWHLNDSRDDFHSNHDRHENIGEGTIGLNEFQHILNHKKLQHLPFIIETPGFDKKGPDKKNLDILKSLISS